MGFIAGVSRSQSTLFPAALDDYLEADHLVRVIDAFVNQQDLSLLGFAGAVPAATGRPGYDPHDLLKLYVYGYFNRVRSSRQLEREAGRNLELMWLLGKLQPDFKTIADFRKDNGTGIQALYRAFTQFCLGQQLITGELVGIDGSKFQAVNSKARHDNEKKLAEHLAALDAKTQAYLEELAHNDAAEVGVSSPSGEQIRAALKTIEEKRAVVRERQKALHDSGQKQYSRTDPESRAMRSGTGNSVIGYNVQIAVDNAHKLIVCVEPTQDGNDRNQLARQAGRAKAILGKDTLHVVADRGYANGREFLACEDKGIIAYVPDVRVPPTDPKHFSKERFVYHAADDTYRCPAQQILLYRSTSLHQGREVSLYKTAACAACLLRTQCTQDKRGRTIIRPPFAAAQERMSQRLAEHPNMMLKRKCLVEHPFGTLKRNLNQGYFLMKGLAKVTTEINLSALVYNLKRVITILGTRNLMAALA